MQRARIHVNISAGFCVITAICLCVLPLSWVVSWFLAITAHELGHFIAVIACGSTVQELKLTVRGAEMLTDMSGHWQEAICSLAGPVCGMLLLLLHRFLPIAALCAFIHSVFNLLPLNQLDGGRALRNLLCMIVRNEKAELIATYIDKLARLVLFFVVLYTSWRMQWFILALFAAILLFKKHGSTKSTCKRKQLQVQ